MSEQVRSGDAIERLAKDRRRPIDLLGSYRVLLSEVRDQYRSIEGLFARIWRMHFQHPRV